MEPIVYPEFDNIPISTKTIIVHTNLKMILKEICKILPITPYIVIPKRRGRKPKDAPVVVNNDIEEGSIISLSFEDIFKGVNLKNKKNVKDKGKKCTCFAKKCECVFEEKKRNIFRNAIAIVMIIENKTINFKITANGKFQITGCKNEMHAVKCVKYIWNYIKDFPGFLYNLPEGEKVYALFLIVMTNKDFDVNFKINRQSLDHHVNYNTNYISLFELSFTYTGVNIKIPFNDKIDIKIRKIQIDDEDEWQQTFIEYDEFVEYLDEKDKKKKLKKQKYHTFLVFYSGKIIMSGFNTKHMLPVYNEFIQFLAGCENIIKERLY